ncbi:MAG: signal peptidase II [Phycisphaerae bacterium]|jgi:signal peptidase II|nr:signal peptidase II [Phycisphaerae bacterium]MBT6282679.1 signal peptidase II [Phycisphaerae bacterium]
MIANPAWKSPRAWIILITVMLLGFSADIATKNWAFNSVASHPVVLERDQLLSNPNWTPIPLHQGKVAIPGRILNFRLVLNDGAVFGIGSQQRFFFIFFTFAALGIASWIFSKHTSKNNTIAHIAIGLVLGGGLGNLYDRVFIGRVRDFMHMLPDRHLPFGWSWPGSNSELFPWIFNTGDVLLLTGMGLLMLFFWTQPTPTTQKPEPAKSNLPE